MRDQAARDEKTLRIGTALFVFALIVGAFAGMVALLELSVPGWVGLLVLVLATLLAGSGLVDRDRMRRR